MADSQRSKCLSHEVGVVLKLVQDLIALIMLIQIYPFFYISELHLL